MKRTKTRMTLCLILTALLLIFIWGNSCLPGQVSGAFSQKISDLINRLLGRFPGDPDAGHGLLRKLAHFTEFACLGASLFLAVFHAQEEIFLSLIMWFPGSLHG